MATKAPVLDPERFKATCPTCGRRFLAHTVGQRGKPKEYDTPECGALARAWTAFQSAFSAVLPRLTLTNLFQWRGLLLGIASERSWNRGLGKQTRHEAEAAEQAADKAALAVAITAARAAINRR